MNLVEKVEQLEAQVLALGIGMHVLLTTPRDLVQATLLKAAESAQARGLNLPLTDEQLRIIDVSLREYAEGASTYDDR